MRADSSPPPSAAGVSGREVVTAKRKWGIRLRWILLAIVGGGTPLINAFSILNIPEIPIYQICALLAAGNGGLQYALQRILRTEPLADSDAIKKWDITQLALDWAAVSLMFHYTGGAASFFLPYFLLHMILIGVLQPSRNRFYYIIGMALTTNAIALLKFIDAIWPVYPASFIPQRVREAPGFVLLVLFFFDAVLFISVLIVGRLMNRLNHIIVSFSEFRDHLEHANQRLELLNQLAKDTTSTLGFHPRLRFICRQVRKLMNVKGVAIYLLDEAANQLDLVSACGLSDQYLSKGPVHPDRSIPEIRRGCFHYIEDAAKDASLEYPEAAMKEGIVSILAVPLQARDKFIGSLRLYTVEKREFTKEDNEFLLALSGQAAVSIENARIYEFQKKQDEIKNEFIRLISHEIKAPLMAIQGILEVMAKAYVGPLTDKQRELVERMSDRIDSIMETSTGLLDMYQWESRGRVELTPVSMNEYLSKAATMYAEIAQNKNIDLKIHLPETELFVRSAEWDLDIVLNNLLSNAIKYTENGGRVLLDLYALEDKVILRIVDTGIGIRAKELAQIFDGRFRAPAAKKKDPYGRGMGLSFVKKIVESRKGKISVKSVPGKGTEFVLSFPKA
ncbi:MAG: GAF domain-containing sensor histidine kinase [Desulfobacterales bacterium]|nr:GAF domain-containing sensor histidine kinase [Desulfobacterales bacterium]